MLFWSASADASSSAIAQPSAPQAVWGAAEQMTESPDGWACFSAGSAGAHRPDKRTMSSGGRQRRHIEKCSDLERVFTCFPTQSLSQLADGAGAANTIGRFPTCISRR
jgi:hypothetical protein